MKVNIARESRSVTKLFVLRKVKATHDQRKYRIFWKSTKKAPSVLFVPRPEFFSTALHPFP